MVKHTTPKTSEATGAAKQKRVLIVEDEVIMRESLRDWLTESGYLVETVERGEEALKTIAEKDIGIAILDLKLPGKNGIEVLREARLKKPELKAIIITAYPSIQTAVEAGKEGAVDYLPKPFDLKDLEDLIEASLTPVEVETKPEAVTEVTEEAAAEPIEVEIEEPEEIPVITPEEMPVHLRQGKAYFLAGRYQEALRELESVRAVAPGNIESRVWIAKTREALATPEEELAEEAKPKYCVWMSMAMVSYRVCTNDYNCMNCEFDQEMQEKMASGDSPELNEALARLRELPGSQRLCRYALKGDVSHRLCTHLFQCEACEFGQTMDDALQKELTQRLAELAAQQEALRKKEQSWWWPYWEPESPRSAAKSHSSH